MRRVALSFVTIVTALSTVTTAGCSLGAEDVDSGGGALSGAIFTTTQDGGAVNANQYDDCRDVYLSGGPKKGGPRLPGGDYYFLVTDPSGKDVLSIDALAERTVTIDASGEIRAYAGGHAQAVDGSDGSVTVQLWPFGATPNPGGEYKVWLVPADAYDAATGAIRRGSAKTDAFKCVFPAEPGATPITPVSPPDFFP